MKCQQNTSSQDTHTRGSLIENIAPKTKLKLNIKETVNTHFKSETSLPKKLMILDVNMKLEKTVNSPAITTHGERRDRENETESEININEKS